MKQFPIILNTFQQHHSAFRVLMCLLFFVWGTTTWAAEYDIYIGGTSGVQVTDDNKDDIQSPYLRSGKIYYLPESNELCLQNVVAEVPDSKPFLYCQQGASFKITLIGENTITVNGGTAIDLYPSTTIGAETFATIKITGADTGIFVSGMLTISKCTMTVSGTEYGIHGKYANYPMKIDDANLLVTGDTKPIYGFYKVDYNQAYLLFPSNVTYSPSQLCFLVTGTTTPSTGSFYFERCHLMVGGEYVYPNTPITAGVKKGTVSYNFSTHTLTLDNATIETTGTSSDLSRPIRFSWQNDMIIRLIGNNEIHTTGEFGVEADNMDYYQFYYSHLNELPAKLSIEGDGSLYIDAEEGYGIGLLASELQVKDATVDMVSKWGVVGVMGMVKYMESGQQYVFGNGKYETLTLDNCYFSYHNTEDYEDGMPLLFIDGLYLVDTEFVSPTDAYFDNGFLLWDGGRASTMVVVPMTAPTAITPATTDREAQEWYTLGGQRIAKPTKPGIYLRNGQKVVIR